MSENFNTSVIKEEIRPSDNTNDVPENNDGTEKLPSIKATETTNESLDNCDEEGGYQSSDEELESNSDSITSEEDYDEIMVNMLCN